MGVDSAVRDHVVALLRGGEAYETFDEIAGAFTPELRGRVPGGAEHSAWQILEHMRFAQRDILDFSTSGSHPEYKWPDDYWTNDPKPPAEQSWDETVRTFHADRETLISLVRDPSTDLLKPLPWGSGQTLLREVLLAADHVSYHLGELVMLKRWLDTANKQPKG